ncbi:MAG: low molecular weight phosphatase family protein [Micrococcaceae bacterium]
MSKPFKIMFVCTGNICRSPFGERVLQAGLDKLSPRAFEVTSSGTYGMLSYDGMAAKSAELVESFGAEVDDFEPRRMNDRMIEDSDLIFGLTQDHRAEIMARVPKSTRKTFTLREFARCLERATLPNAKDIYTAWTNLVAQCADLRSQVSVEAEDDDVLDPYGRSMRTYKKMALQMMPAIDQILFAQEKIKKKLTKG